MSVLRAIEQMRKLLEWEYPDIVVEQLPGECESFWQIFDKGLSIFKPSQLL